MRYHLTTLAAAVAVIILLLAAALACGGNGNDGNDGSDDNGANNRGDDALAPGDPDFQATIDAALARIAATRIFSEDTNGASAPAATTPPAASPAAADATTTVAPPTPRPSPTADAGDRARPSPTPPPPVPPGYELSAVRNWDYANQETPAAVARIRSIGWIADGVQTPNEFNAAEHLVNIAIDTIDAPDTLDIILNNPAVSQQLVPLTLPALLSLQRMAQDRPERLAQLAAAPWFRDGLTLEEAAIVAILYERSRFRSPEFDDIVSDPNILNIAVSATAGADGSPVPVIILRTGPPPPASPVLAAAQIAVPIYEELFQAPLPMPAVIIHITPYVAGVAAGTNYQTHITLKPSIDAGEQPGFDAHAVWHEIAHYYLYANPQWYAEGGAEFAASYAAHAVHGQPIAATNSPCAAAASISELERRLPADASGSSADASDPDDAGLWRCNYSLGERLMLSLYRQLGEERFLQGWRSLYAQLINQPDYPSQREFAPDDLRIAWISAGGIAAQPDLEHIWDQWYRGSADRTIASPPDTAPVDPSLPAVNGRLDEAYIALNQLGDPLTAFSARSVNGFVYLILKYSYSYEGPPQEIALEVAEYYQDGFGKGRRHLDITAEARHIGGTQWLSVGPSPPEPWAPGRYWIYVYENDRKIAEVPFEVTP